MENNWYVYRHLKLNGEVFYIGIGQSDKFKRAYDKINRSKYWKSVVNKHGYEVQVLTTKLTKEEAIHLEVILIDYYKRADCCGGTLVNMTDGGEGTCGYKHIDKKLNEEHKENIRKAFIGLRVGSKHPMYGKKGKDNPKFGSVLSETTKNKISKTRISNKSAVGGRNSGAKKVININTLEILPCAKDILLIENYVYSTLIGMLSNRNPNKTNWVFLEDFSSYEKNNLVIKKKSNVEIINTVTLEEYKSISKASMENNIPYNTLYYDLFERDEINRIFKYLKIKE